MPTKAPKARKPSKSKSKKKPSKGIEIAAGGGRVPKGNMV